MNTVPLIRLLAVCLAISFPQNLVGQTSSRLPLPGSETPDSLKLKEFFSEYCIDCHGAEGASADVAIESILDQAVSENSTVLEQVVRQLRARRMPPVDERRPDESTYQDVVATLASALDRAAQKHPRPGRTETFRRLNRTEYQNAIRDLLLLEIDAAEMLPKDDESHGFDNVTVGNLSPTRLDRYITASQKISRLALGRVEDGTEATTIRIRPDVTQESHVPGLPFGTRGGTLIKHTFPKTGQYEIEIRLTRDRNEEIEGLRGVHQLDLLLDRNLQKSFEVKRPADGVSFVDVDKHLRVRIEATAGPHEVGVTFQKKPTSLLETERQPFNSHFNFHRHPRINPAIFQVSITGPYGPGTSSDWSQPSPSRKHILTCDPHTDSEHLKCATQILLPILRRAYRRPVGDEDLKTPLKFFQESCEESGFEAGIEMALCSILVNPQFLFRIEKDPPGLASKSVYPIADIELASRISFFLWSSIPDDELLSLAETGKLRDPGILEQQIRRMLRDPRSQSLVDNFASQWLYLRNLDAFTPEARSFPDFDDNLRQSLGNETRLFFGSILREDRSVLDLIQTDYTFLNERLAKHYQIPHIQGSHFRRVDLGNNSERGGLLRQGSILTVTSYATRTSPVIRGQWILKNILGVPSPPPPGNVASLDDNTVDADLPMRERLAAHRNRPECASCHRLMDPVGFSLENFDAVGRWREFEAGEPIDVRGGLPDGSEFSGVAGLETKLLARPELFVGTLTEKLLTFAVGRGVEFDDAPAIREIVRNAKQDDFCFSSLILGIVKSQPFQMRTTE
jgi:hypothetical protein